jgi:hypothetical protein
MACSFVFGAPCQFRSLAGLEHGRTIPFSDIGRIEIPQRTTLPQLPPSVSPIQNN